MWYDGNHSKPAPDPQQKDNRGQDSDDIGSLFTREKERKKEKVADLLERPKLTQQGKANLSKEVEETGRKLQMFYDPQEQGEQRPISEGEK